MLSASATVFRPTLSLARGCQTANPAVARLRLSTLAVGRRTVSCPFSTRPSRLERPRKTLPNGTPASQIPSWETNFAGLGLSRNMKVFLVVAVCFFGTIEAWFWAKTLWLWWKGRDAEAAPED